MNVAALRSQFPALAARADRAPPIYLDSACMSLVPRPVLDAMEEYYRDFPGCAGRSLHRFAEEVNRRFEGSRSACARFLGRSDPRGVVFVRNATEAINLVAQGIAWQRGDRVLLSDREHNSNLVVWQRLAAERGIRIEIVAVPDEGPFDVDAIVPALERGVRLVSLFHTSNLDGRTLPIRAITERAHDAGAEVLFDGCQAAPHERVDLDRIGVDYYALSGHKMLGPTGTGVLAAAFEPLSQLRPLVLGGETVERTTLTSHELRPPPHRFEAGLQNYAGALGLHAALDFLSRVGLDEIRAQQLTLNRRVTEALADERRVRTIGPAEPAERPSIFAFALEGIDCHDAALFLDEGHGVMVRSGMNCVHSWYDRHGLAGTVRASFYLYNDPRDADGLVDGLRELLARIPGDTLSGTSAGTAASPPRRASGRRRSAGSSAAAARSARPRGRAGRGRAGSAAGSG
jgi:cysteine desulfurase/selenocysteine lyase